MEMLEPKRHQNSKSNRKFAENSKRPQIQKPLIDLNDLSGSAHALRKLASQLESLQNNQEHGNREAYALPRGHFVKRVDEKAPEKSKKLEAKSRKSPAEDDEEDESAESESHDQSADEDEENTPKLKKSKLSKSKKTEAKDVEDHDDSESEDADEEKENDEDEHGESEDGKDDRKAKVKDGEKKKKFKFTPGRIAAMVAVVCILLGAVSIFLYHMHTYESTDDASIQAHATLLAPKVSGIVTQVLVDEHEHVKAGQVLVKIEPKDYEASLDNSRANFESLKVQLQNARRDLARASELVKDHAITDQDYDHARANYQELDRKVRAAMSEVDQSKLNLDYTEIRAPTDGMIGRKSVEVGMNASAGTALLGFIQNDERWVIANFKETQLSSIQPGKKVKVEVDAISGHDFEGVVESISPSSGATFTLFPPDNATGNFTKVVQRVPVKIYLKNLSERDIESLEAGLSAVVSVYKNSERENIPSRPFLTYTNQVGQSLPLDQQAQELPPGSQNTQSLSRPAKAGQSVRAMPGNDLPENAQ